MPVTTTGINNVVLIRDATGYRLVPAGEAVGGGNLDRSAAGQPPEPGYGITVIPLRYVSATTLISSMPSSLDTSNARSQPSCSSAPAISSR